MKPFVGLHRYDSVVSSARPPRGTQSQTATKGTGRKPTAGRRRRRRSLLHVLSQKLARLLTLLVGGALGAAAVVVCLVLIGTQVPFVSSAVRFDVERVGALEPLNERSIVFDRYGRTIAVLRSEQNRSPITLDQVPKHLINAVLDVEDADFYVHKGVNLRSTVRAFAANVEAGGVAQGGSTITQQLVKLTLLSPKQDLNRKVTEARLALQIEKEYTKNQILERYLNSVYFGEGAYGVEAAAERYFNTSAAKLKVAQSAFLAGMIRNPTGYDPIRFRERSRQRRSVVLERMVVRKHLTRAEADALKSEPMPRPLDRLARPDTYFIEKVKQTLLDDKRLGETSKDRYNAVFNGGLKIFTTFDPLLQSQAEQAITEILPDDEPDFTAALVSVDATSGAVRAIVGGRGFSTDKYDLATQGKRQPGSSWKPFVYIAALEAGMSPNSSISGVEPCPIPNPGGTPDPYEPSNAEPGSGKSAVLGDQLVASSNCAFARLAYVVGYDKVAAVAKRMGITTNIDLVPAMALGVEEVRPIEMAGAYATIASEGVLRTPYLIEEVRDRDNRSVFKTKVSTRRVIDREITRIVTADMRRVVTGGTGTAARLDDHEAAGKTGTTNNFEDAWFVGFTPTLATAVWMGAPDKKKSMRNVGGVRVYGGTYPARVWKQFMTGALDFVTPVPFTDPDTSAFGKGECIAIKFVRGKDGKLVPASTTSTSIPSTSISSTTSSSTPSTTSSSTPTTSTSRPRSSNAPSALGGSGGRGFASSVNLAANEEVAVAAVGAVPGKVSTKTATTVAEKKKSRAKNSKRQGCADSLTGYPTKTKTKTKKTTKRKTTIVPSSDAVVPDGGVDIPEAEPVPAVDPAPAPEPAPSPEPAAPQPEPVPVAIGPSRRE